MPAESCFSVRIQEDIFMKRLLQYMKDMRGRAVLAPLFKCLEACFELFVPLVVAAMIDNGINQSRPDYVWGMCGLMILLGVIGLACSILAQWFAANVAVHVGTKFRNDLHRHIHSLGYAEIDRLGTSTLITRMTSDINQVQTGVNMFLRLFMRSPFVVFGAMVMAFTVDFRAALIFAVAIPVLSAVVFAILLATMPLYRKVQKQLDTVLRTARENLLGVRVIRAFHRQKAESEQFKEENDRLVGLQVFVGKISALLNPVTYVIINLAVIAILYTGGRQVDSGELTQGQVVALINYMSQILVELIKLANLIITISKAFACLNRVNSVFDVQPSVTEPAEALRPDWNQEELISFSHVNFTYPSGKEPALSDISFSVRRGETVGVIGGTGCGKTTMVNLIPRFYDISSGEIRIGGQDIRRLSLSALQSRIGMVPQKAVLFSGTLRENLRWGRKDASDQEMTDALLTAQAGFVLEDPRGLDREIEQGGRNLSGGQRQRLTIARALVRRPEILILDDSASALDFATDAALRKAIRENTENMTVFLISQRAATVRGADKILVLEEGRLAGCGTHSQLFESCQVYREICLSQLSREEAQSHV